MNSLDLRIESETHLLQVKEKACYLSPNPIKEEAADPERVSVM